jgi:TP901 family phage tail tape measure protein
MDSAEFEDAAKKASRQMDSWSKDLKSVGQQATQLGTSLTKTLTLPILGVGAASLKMAMDFESSFAGVRKTVDATDAEFKQMEQSFRDLSKTIPVNVNELNRLGEAAGALGIPKEQIVEFSKVMAMLGVTTNLTSDQAADAIARIQNIFGAAGKDTDRLASTIVALGNSGASTEKEITEMAQRIAGAGHTVGLTQAQVVGFASTLASVGINAEAGGSAISRIFLKMNDAVMKGGGGLKEFARVAGMSAGEFKRSFETDAAGATVKFIDGLGRLKGEGENINATIEGMIGKNIILKDTLFRLSGAGGELSRQLAVGNKAWQENSALTKEAEQRFKTFESQLTLFWNKLKDVGITLGNSLLPLMRDLLTLAEPLINGIAKLADWFGKLPEPIRLTAVGIAGLVAAIGPLLFVFGQIITSAGLVAGAFGAKGLAVKTAGGLMATMGATTIPGLIAALGPLVVAVAGVTAAVAIGTQAWKLWGEQAERNKGVELEQQRRYAMMEQAAKIAGRSVLTYAEAVEIVTKHVRKNVDEQERMQTVYTEAAGPPERLAPKIRRIAEVSDEVTEALKKQQEALKQLKDEYSGANTFAEAAMHMKAIGDVTKLTQAEQQRALGVLQGALDKYNALGQKAPQALLMTVIQLDAMNTKLKDSTNLVEALGMKFETSLAKAPILNQFDPLKFLEPLKAGLKSAGLAGGVSFGGAVLQGMKGAFTQLGPTILGAIQGGGNVLQSVGSLFGMSLGDSFVKNFGTKITGALGATLGGAFNALIPGLGALLGPLLGKIGGFFKDLFGIDPAVKAARKTLEGFQSQLREGLTDAQRLEAGNEQWKMDVIAVRDAFIAVGRSEAEALKLVEALWDTDNPERSKRAMEEIQRVMEQIKNQTEGATDAAEDLGDALDNATRDRVINITVEEPQEWRGPGDFDTPGGPFSGGSQNSLTAIPSSSLASITSAPSSLAAATSAGIGASTVTNTTSAQTFNNFLPIVFGNPNNMAAVIRAVEMHMAERGIKGNEEGLRDVIENVAAQVFGKLSRSGAARA